VKTQQKLDHYRVGEVAGPSAFSAGDWVVIRTSGNAPARVESVDPMGFITVVLGCKSDSVYGMARYFPSDLGYRAGGLGNRIKPT
jgi:hypothetical protein